MWLTSLLQNWAQRNRARRNRGRCHRQQPAARSFRPRLDCREDRTLPSSMVGVVFDAGAGPLPQLPVDSYSWGATHADGTATSMQDFTITLAPGSTEPGLWGHLAVGKPLDTATIQLSKAVGPGETQVYTTYTLTNVTITSFKTSEEGGTAPQDTIGLHFDKISQSFSVQKPDGTPDTPNIASYDLAKATGEAGSLKGESAAKAPPLVFVEDGVALRGSEISGYTWSAPNPAASHTSMQDFTITLAPGSTEPGLWGHLAIGKPLDTATIQLSKAVGPGETQVYTTYTLTNVTITSFKT